MIKIVILFMLGSGISLIFILVWIWLWKNKKEFEIAFLALYCIGFFQGFIDKITIISSKVPTSSLWGPLKYCIMITIIVGIVLRILNNKRILINNGMKFWIFILFLNWMMFAVLMVEAKMMEPRYVPLNTIQNFGIVNMLMCLFIYFNVRQVQIDSFLKLLIFSGFIASVFGIIQIILGPTKLASMGINIFEANSFASVASDDLSESILNAMRAFSFFSSHHGFSAFLIISIISLQILRNRGKISTIKYIIGMFSMWIGMACTLNLTNIMLCIGALIAYWILFNTNATFSIYRVLSKKSFWKTSLLLFVMVSIVLATIEPVRKRVFGAFDFREGAQSAGGSLYSRHVFIKNGLQAISERPLGLGLYLGYINNSEKDIPGYARGDYFSKKNILFSSDCWFLWLMVQLGLVCFSFYLLCFLFPLLWCWIQQKNLATKESKALFYGLISLLTITIIGGVSNSPTLVFTPSNLLIWAIIGLLFKMPDWERQQ